MPAASALPKQAFDQHFVCHLKVVLKFKVSEMWVHALAWTLSDLDGTARPDADHVGRALYLRKAAR